MQLTTNEVSTLLRSVLSRNNVTAKQANEMLQREAEGKATAAELAVLNRMTRQVNEGQKVAKEQKRSVRGDKSLRELRLRMTYSPMKELESIAKGQAAIERIRTELKGKTTLTREQAVMVFTHTVESSEHPLTVSEISRRQVMSECADLVKLAVRRCRSMGFKVA